MNQDPGRWHKPRGVSVVVDNPSWVLPFAETFVSELNAGGDNASLCRDHASIGEGAVAFFLGCVMVTPPEILARNQYNLVVHASDLPKGRGFSPLSWLILEGENRIPVCLLEVCDEVDSGPVIFKQWIDFEGHELIGEMREALGQMSLELCRRFMEADSPPVGEPQSGNPSVYGRRRPEDSRLDPEQSILAQFNLLRIVDNDHYPAFFEHQGHRYKIRIEKSDE